MGTLLTRSRNRVLAGMTVGFSAFALMPAAPASASFAILCGGFSGCNSSGLSDHGYGANYARSWWGQTAGHNCTNYAAFRLTQAGVGNPGLAGNAGVWGSQMRVKGYPVNGTPAVGAVGWYSSSSRWAPGWGHVSIVESVTPTTVTLSEDSITGNGFRYRQISRNDATAMPTGFIHVKDGAGSTSAGSFADVFAGSAFATEINWLAAKGISTGWTVNGVRFFQPTANITREAMAAFVYRFSGSPAFTAPTRSPFVDVPVGAPFYKQISWLASKGIATGTRVAGGAAFSPKSSITREAMAAFLYRVAGSPASSSTASRFKDVPASAPFAKEINWLGAAGISTGWVTASGTRVFAPKSAVTRSAMAAFLYRADKVVH